MPDINPQHEYLGDGVYASFDGYHVWLRTGSHDNEHGQIALDPDVFESIVRYRRRALDKLTKHLVETAHAAEARRGGKA